jgi:hypothetical protein
MSHSISCSGKGGKSWDHYAAGAPGSLEVRVRTHLADYRLLQPLEQRRGGVSWLAEPPSRLGEPGPVVVTELPTEAAWAEVIAQLAGPGAVDSPHLIRPLEAGRSDDDPAVTWTSRTRGVARPLDRESDERATVLLALSGAARGADTLHHHGLVHGAITAGAVLFDGSQGILDLSPERASLVPPVVARATGPDELDGMEPDAIWGSGPTPTSDVFALGAAAHALLTGRLLHPDLVTDPPVTAVQRVLIDPPTLDPSLDEPLRSLIASCLAPDPAQRPASAGELADRLERVRASETSR